MATAMETLKAIEAIEAKAKREKEKHLDGLREVIKEKTTELDALQDALTSITGKAVKIASGERQKRMTKERMEQLIALLPEKLEKKKEYQRSEIMEAIGAEDHEMQSVLLRAKTDKILKTNGQKGKGGRSQLV